MKAETIGVTITYKEPLTFHLQMIGIDEEKQLRQKMFGIPDAEKAEKQYQLNVDLLADLSEEIPTVYKQVTEKQAVPLKESEPQCDMEYKEVTLFKDVPIDETGVSVSKAVRDYFAGKTVMKERVAEYAVRGYFLKLSPDVSFL